MYVYNYFMGKKEGCTVVAVTPSTTILHWSQEVSILHRCSFWSIGVIRKKIVLILHSDIYKNQERLDICLNIHIYWFLWRYMSPQWCDSRPNDSPTSRSNQSINLTTTLWPHIMTKDIRNGCQEMSRLLSCLTQLKTHNTYI